MSSLFMICVFFHRIVFKLILYIQGTGYTGQTHVKTLSDKITESVKF